MRCNGFRPLAGFWFLNDFKATVNDKSVSRFRPLAGFWFLNGAAFHRRAGFLICFRPLAGFWFLNCFGEYPNPFDSEWFPSPCGVLVLK